MLTLKISEIGSGKNIDFVEGNVIKTSKIVIIYDQDVSHAYLCDETGTIKITFWGDYAGELKNGDCIRIENGKESWVKGEKNISISRKTNGVIKKIKKQIVCKEEIIDKTKFRKINEVIKDINPLYVEGKISEKTRVGAVSGKKGKQNRANAELCDETGTIGITLWDDDAVNVNDGDCVRIENGYSNEFNNKLNVQSGSYGTLKKISEQINCTDVETHDEIKLVKIKDLGYNDKHVSVEGKLKVGQIIEGKEELRLIGYLCDETGTIGITLWKENTKFSDGESIRIEGGRVSTPGEKMLTEGYYGKVYRIDKNFDCEHTQDSSVDEEIEKI